MANQPTLRPSDLIVALQLTITPAAQFLSIAGSTGLSAGECHNAVRRLRLSGLVIADERAASAELLWQFLVHGAPYAFPAVMGPDTVGVPTGQSSPPFSALIASPTEFVWAHPDGTNRGQSLTPLYPAAPSLPGRNPALYDLVAIFDALRSGSIRVRNLAASLLAERLRVPAA